MTGNAILVFQDKKITGIEINSETIIADQVIITAGAWAHELIRPLGIEFQVSAQKAQIVHLQIPDMDTSQWPVVMPPNNQYMLDFEGGKIVAGAAHEDISTFDCRVTAGDCMKYLIKLLLLPQASLIVLYLKQGLVFGHLRLVFCLLLVLYQILKVF